MSQSSDTNSMENLWLIFYRKRKNHKPSYETELFNILNDYWQQLSSDLCQSLVERMTKYCQAVIDTNGYRIKY